MFYLHRHTQIVSKAHRASYPKGARVTWAGAWNGHLTTSGGDILCATIPPLTCKSL